PLLDIMGWSSAEVSKVGVPTYPCLIDEKHIVAELYNMVNVPTAVWINEEGQIVRPPEPAGMTDALRDIDPATFQMPEHAAARVKHNRKMYVDAVRDWVQKGDKSSYVLSPEAVRRRMQGPTDEQALAAANFRLGEYLYQQGHQQDARHYFAEAHRLRPESWNYFRQDLELQEVGKASGPEFFAEVMALGDKLYYPRIDMTGMR
ncbi:MAG: redoxin domain-containing (seleno)protein, partial [Candidatus Binatia bacterium]